jgi:hypothetical protein
MVDSSGALASTLDDLTSTGAYAAVSIGTSAGVIKAARASRRSIVVQNAHAANVLTVGMDSSVTTSNGIRLGPGDSLTLEGYTGAVYGIASAASTDVRYFEVG